MNQFSSFAVVIIPNLWDRSKKFGMINLYVLHLTFFQMFLFKHFILIIYLIVINFNFNIV